MTLIIERIFASFLLITGISYLVQRVIWKELVQEFLKKPTWLMFWSLLFLPLGLIIVFGHNLWVGNWPVIITVVGWIITIKCTLYLLVPNWASFVQKWSDEFLERYIAIAGIIEAILGGVLLVLSFVY